jgi:hypothetical protein
MKILKNKFFIYFVVFVSCAGLAFLIYHFANKKEDSENDIDDSVVSSDGVIIEDDKMIDMNVIGVEINGNFYTAELEGTETSNDFFMMSPLTITMEDLNNNEKYYYLSNSLSSNSDDYTGEIHRGDIMLYNTNCIVIFYKDFNTNYYYKKIGHINDLPELEDGNMEVSFVR